MQVAVVDSAGRVVICTCESTCIADPICVCLPMCTELFDGCAATISVMP